MKKMLYCVAAFAMLLFAWSCQRETLEPVYGNGTVTITVETPGAIDTRTIADGENVNEVHYAVYKTAAGDTYSVNGGSSPLAQGFVDMAGKRATVKFDLLQDQEYTVIFWAQVRGAGHYELGDLRQIKVNSTVVDGKQTIAGNDETRAAFFAKYEFDTYENKDHTVTLYRPFAQLNLLTTEESLTPNQEGQTQGYTIDVKKSQVVVTGLSTAFNTVTGIGVEPADPTAEFVYSLSATPEEQGQKTLKVNDVDYHYVSMNYLFVPTDAEDNAALVGVKYVVNTDKGDIDNSLVNVPVRENYRTNVIGNLLTKTTEFVIIVDKDFNVPEIVIGEDWTHKGNYNYTVSEGASEGALADLLKHADEQAKAAATKTEGPVVTIDLSGDVYWETGAGIGSNPLLPEDSPISAVVINGNGKTFTATGAGVGKIRLANGGRLTLNALKIVDESVSYAENSWEYGYLEFGGAVRLEDCEVVNAIMLSCETAALKNCSFNSGKDNEYAVWVDNGSAYFTGCTFTGARGLKTHEEYGTDVVKVTVDGCTFGPLTLKPGMAIGTVNAETVITIKNSTFKGCQAGEQNMFIYESDTDVNSFTFTLENNVIIPGGDEVIEQEDGSLVVATAEAFREALAASYDTIPTIKLADGVYEGLFLVSGKSLNIEALNEGKATINGKLAIAASGKTVNVKGIVFENSYTGPVTADHQYLDKTGRYAIGLYCASVNVEKCTFNLSTDGGINFYAINDPEYCTVNSCTFNCNGFRPILSKVNVTVDGCTFNDQYKYSLQVWGNKNNSNEAVVFTNNTLNEPGKTSGCKDAYKSWVSISKSYPIADVAFTIAGNTEGYNFVYDDNANVDITSCSLNGNRIVEGQCFTPAGVDDVKEVLAEAAWTYDESTSTYSIYTARALKWVAAVVNATTPYTPTIFDNATVQLMNDIDLQNEEWIPIGDDRSQRTEWHGVFDGRGYKVSNVKITKKTDRDDENKSSYGLFGNVKGTVKNLTVSNVSISGAPKFIGALVGRLNNGLIENCHVKESYVECNNWTIGGLVGQYNDGKISGCSVENTTVKGYGAVGAIAGIALNKGERTIENCSVKGCSIVQNGSFGGSYDMMYGAVLGAAYNGELTVNINGCTVSNTTVKGVQSQTLCGYISEGDKVLVDGAEIVADGVAKEGQNFYVSSAAGLAYMNNVFADKSAGHNAVINLTSDIDFTGYTWTPVDSHADSKFTFAGLNGKGHTISNMTINGQAMFTRFAGSGDVVVKDVTFDNAVVSSSAINTSVLTVQSYQNVILDNVDVRNSTITGAYKVAPLIATLYNESSTSVTATLKDCDVENVTVKATSYDFCTAGMVAFVYADDNDRIEFENCSVSNVKLIAPADSYKAHAAVYTAGSESLYNEAAGVTVTNVTFEAL